MENIKDLKLIIGPCETSELAENVIDWCNKHAHNSLNICAWAITFPSIKMGCTVLSLDEVKLIKKTYEELND